MARERFVFFYQLQSLLKPAFSKISLAYFVLYFSPALLWTQTAQASGLIDSPSDKNQSEDSQDWELANVQVVSFRPPILNPKSTSDEIARAGLVREAKELYEAGQFSMAVQTWRQATEAYQSIGDRLSLAMALSSLALAYQQLGQIDLAFQASAKSLELARAETKPENSQSIASILNNQASLQLAAGQAELALKTWKKAATLYQAAGNRLGRTWIGLNSALALQTLGFYRRAVTTLDEVNENLHSLPDSPMKVVTLHSFGNALRGVGDLARSRQILAQSLSLARKLGLRNETNAVLISLGNVARSQGDLKAAWEFYQQAAGSRDKLTATGAKINSLSLLIEQKAFSPAGILAQQIAQQIKDLPPKRATIYAQINFAQSLKKLRETPNSNKTPSYGEIAQLLVNSIQIAKSIEDSRAEAYAKGCLGSLYEHTGQWSDAKKLTQQALALAGGPGAPDINYRFSWQLGRILKAQGDINGALASYTRSTNALKALRNDIVAVSPTLQFDFRDEVEPVYRELAGLLLLSNQPSQQNLIQARDAIEALQVAELNNFFRTACLETKPIQVDSAIDKLDEEAAVIYPIILPDRLEVIVKLPNQPLQHYRANVTQKKIEKLLQEFRQNLTTPYLRDNRLLSKQLHDWLIEPALDSLAKSKVKTLVFVLDGALRQIPMAALYDGKQYLIQKYAVALNPGLSLLPPQPIKKVKLKALTAGLSEPRSGFSALTNVPTELNKIKSSVKSTVLLNQDFTVRALLGQLEDTSFPIVHVATHGQFSSMANKTFILAWDKPIVVSELDTLLRSTSAEDRTIELFVLSACETADGDNRAALGLAGIAIRAGARSTVASLWSSDDESNALLIGDFYQNLIQGMNKAQALRTAQLALLENPRYQHTKYWSAFVLVGNWL